MRRKSRKSRKTQLGFERLDQRIAPSGFAAPGRPIPGHPGMYYGSVPSSWSNYTVNS